MMLEISSALADTLRARAAASPEVEICGLLFGTTFRVEAAQACPNIAADPRTSFEIDPAALVAAYRAARQGGPAPIGHYHSHPTGSPLASARDHAAAAGDDAIWLIVAQGEIAAWRAVAQGALAPIELRIVASSDPEGTPAE